MDVKRVYEFINPLGAWDFDDTMIIRWPTNDISNEEIFLEDCQVIMKRWTLQNYLTILKIYFLDTE